LKAVRRSCESLLVALIVLAAVSLHTGAATAGTRKVIDVFPGPHAIADALAKAHAGDTLAIHTGTYTGGVNIKVKAVTLRSAGDGPVTLDGQCTANSTIEVKADDVMLQGPMTIQGGGFFEVDVKTFTGAHITGLTVVESGCDAEYGINVFQSGPILIDHNIASGFGDSGIYVGGITDTGSGHILVAHNEVFGSSSGIILENSFGPNVNMVVGPNNLHDNTVAGIYVTNTDGVIIKRNTTRRDGTYGIELDAESDTNVVRGNTAKGNQFDLANLGGTGNCFKNNVFTTSEGDISC